MDSGEKRVEETRVDRISELPDSLLLHILSLMPTDETLVTNALSKRWRYLWHSLDTFSFSTEDYCEEYVSYVDYVLGHSVSSKIKTFELDSHESDAYKSDINRWLSFAVEKKVENVTLRSYSTDHVCAALPECLYTCSSLITLVLEKFFHYDAHVPIAWKSLKSIKLEFGMLSDDHIVNLLSGCPALESMELSIFMGFNRLEIRTSKLKILNLHTYYDDGGIDHSLEIVAPYLQHLEISGDLSDLKCRLVDVSSVVNAKLSFNITCIKDFEDNDQDSDDEEEDSRRDYHQDFEILVQDYLQKLSCASEITIGTWFIEVCFYLKSPYFFTLIINRHLRIKIIQWRNFAQISQKQLDLL
ncbi:F-box/LRR-repeat protein At3g26922-like [Lycium ferocissimum]|uniref:F-box/LRR-repeat protein At3g26922-like n=1 Tax=Lycium ferocissimum TaxID=112874 RepID=UPI0028166A43|nr:F-box/LRR-repeat protein At3g26922-like [Lycium ferocissimum]